MSFFDKIKLIIGKFLLRRRLKGFERKREVKNIHQCNSILILSFLPEDENASKTIGLAKELKQMKKEVFTLIYAGDINEINSIQIADINIISNDQLNRYFIPNDAYLYELMSREFDLLIDLSLSDQFPLKYIYSLSRAKLKSGAAMNYKAKYGDVLIDVSKEEEVPYLIAQIKHYLSNINTQNQYVT